MEKHQLSTMIAGLSLLVAIISVIVPSVYAGDDEDNKKDLCEENEGDWEDGQCDFATDDDDKVDAFSDDLAELKKFEEEKASLEDALCDDPEDSDKYDVCQSATLAFASSDKSKDKDISRYDVDVLCDASEDYEAHKEQCDKLYDSVEEDTTLAFAESNSKKEDKEFAKELCESDKYNGEWKGGECTNFPDGRDSAWMGFGDECESSDFREEHPYFCGEKE